MTNFYEVLGLEKQALHEDIKTAYRKLALQCHPDKNSGNTRAVAEFQELNEAYECLSDENRRLMYDATLRVPHQTWTKAPSGRRRNREAKERAERKRKARAEQSKKIRKTQEQYRAAQQQAAREAEKTRKEEEARKADKIRFARWESEARPTIVKISEIEAKIKTLEANIRENESQACETLTEEAVAGDQAEYSNMKDTRRFVELEDDREKKRTACTTQLVGLRLGLSADRGRLEALKTHYGVFRDSQSEQWQEYMRDLETSTKTNAGDKGQDAKSL